MSVFAFELPNQPKASIYAAWKGMSWNNGLTLLISDETGEVEFKGTGRGSLIGIEGTNRAHAIGTMSPDELKTGKTFPVDGLGSVRVYIKKIAFGIIQKICVELNGKEIPGHEIIEYRGMYY